MPSKVSYLGTKRKIASRVAALIEESPSGPLLDLFSGICAVGSAVAPSRQIWCNDIQRICVDGRVRPAVVYADPPYTSDHYSRYCDLYETLILYDYPLSEATGRYRPDGFFSRFSIKKD